MKKIMIFCLMFLFLSAASAQAHVITFNPLLALFGFTVVDYEMPIYEGMGLEWSGTGYGYTNPDWSYSAFSVGVMPKFYFNGTAPNGPWWGPIFRYTNGTVELKTSKHTASIYTMSGGLMTGYRWIFGSKPNEGFVLELGVGYLFTGLPAVDVDGESFSSAGNVSGVAVKFDIGWAF